MVFKDTARHRSTIWRVAWMHWAWHTGLSGGTQRTLSWQVGARHLYILSSYKCWLTVTTRPQAMIRTLIARSITGLLDCLWQREGGYASWRSTSMRGGGMLASTAKLLATGRLMMRMGW